MMTSVSLSFAKFVGPYDLSVLLPSSNKISNTPIDIVKFQRLILVAGVVSDLNPCFWNRQGVSSLEIEPRRQANVARGTADQHVEFAGFSDPAFLHGVVVRQRFLIEREHDRFGFARR